MGLISRGIRPARSFSLHVLDDLRVIRSGFGIYIFHYMEYVEEVLRYGGLHIGRKKQ
jgi:hypothetical protein